MTIEDAWADDLDLWVDIDGDSPIPRDGRVHIARVILHYDETLAMHRVKHCPDGDDDWAFWLHDDDTTSYLHADLTVEWYGSICPGDCPWSPGGDVIILPSGRLASEIVANYKPVSILNGNHTIHYLPGPEHILAALALARADTAKLGPYSVWRCKLCSGPGAGGLPCPNCGASFDEAHP